MIKCLRPHTLNNFIRRLRDKNHFYDEIKWKKVNNKNLSIMKKLIDHFFTTYNVNFYCIVLYKGNMDFNKYFNNNFFKVYQSFTILLLKKSIQKNEITSVIADHYSTPYEDEFEAKVRNYVNNHNKKLSIHSIVRMHSKGCNLIQLTDLLIGAVNYEFKVKNNLLKNPTQSKLELLKYLKNKIKISDLRQNIKLGKFNVIIFNPIKKRT